MKRVAVAVAIALAALVALIVIGWPASAYLHNDFIGFWVGSHMLLAGQDPYQPQAFLAAHEQLGSKHYAINPPGIGYGYPLTAAVVFAPFAFLPVSVAAPLWLVVQIGIAVTGLVLLARTLFPRTLRRDLPVLLAVAGSSQPAVLLAAGGNITGFLLGVPRSPRGCWSADVPSSPGWSPALPW